MKSDIITIEAGGRGIDAALTETEKIAKYNGLTSKEQLRLRLLAEEMTGTIRWIVGDMTSSFWIEAENGTYELHLTTMTMMDSVKRKKLLSTSSSGKNEAAKGFMGKLWDIFMKMDEPENMHYPKTFVSGYVHSDSGAFDAPMGVDMQTLIGGWSMNSYKGEVQKDPFGNSEEWDELEKSIVAKLADEVRISISGNIVEMVIYKSF